MNQQRLSEFLKRDQDFIVDLGTSHHGSETKSSVKQPFLTLYELDSDRREATGTTESGRTFQTATQFEVYPQLLEEDAKPQLLFLRGYPSPEWLNTIGAKYEVDPEFFARHLDFLEPHSLPTITGAGLQSYLENMIQFDIATIGSRDSDMRDYKQAEIDDLRKSDSIAMRNYSEKLMNSESVTTGNALVRRYSTFDQVHFAIEQRVSIYIHERGNSWTCECPKPAMQLIAVAKVF